MLESKEFSKIANKVVLYYNDYYTEGGKKPCKIFKIRWFPTVKLIDKNGIEKSSLVGPYFDSSLYLKWIALVNKGINENTGEMLSKNGKLSLKDASDFAYVYMRNPALVISVLENVLALYNGNDYKSYAFTLTKFVDGINYGKFVYGDKFKDKVGKSPENLVKECEKFISNISQKGKTSKAYLNLVKLKKDYLFEDKFGSYSDAKEILQSKDFREFFKNCPDVVGLCTYIFSKKNGEESGLKILSENKPEPDAGYVKFRNFSEAVSTAGEAAFKDGNKEFAKKCGELLLENLRFIMKNKPGMYYAFLYNAEKFNAKTRTITIPLAQTLIEKIKKNPSNTAFYNKVISVYLQGERKDKAIEFLKTYVDTPEFEKLEGKRGFARMLNSLCWTFVEFGKTDHYLIKLMDKSLKIDNNPGSIDTLANLYALKGDYKKAVELEKSAVEILKKQNAPERKIQPYVELIKEWEKKLSGK